MDSRGGMPGTRGRKRTLLVVALIPIVVVEAPTPPPAPAHVEMMLKVCTAGLPRGRCVRRGDRLQPGEQPQAVAVVHLQGETGASLEVGASFEEQEGWTEQSLVFSPIDPPEERFKTIGLLIASLASSAEAFSESLEADLEPKEEAETHSNPEAKPPAPDEKEDREVTSAPVFAEEEPKREEPSADEVSPRPPPRTFQARAFAAVQGGVGFLGADGRSDGVRVGPLGRLGIEAAALRVQLEVGMGWAKMPKNGLGLTSNFLSYDFGLVGRWPVGALRLGPAAHALVERTEVALVSASSGESDRRARWQVGWGLGASASYSVSEAWELRCDGQWLSMNGGTAVEVDGVRVGRIGAQNVRLDLGVAFTFGP